MPARLYNPTSEEVFKISRSKIDLFVNCPRCFYLDQRLGIKRPSGPGFSLNSAVDVLLKKEFDLHRANKTPHPLMTAYGIDAAPFDHEKIDQWRHNFTGVQYVDPTTNFLIYGAIDDVWIDKSGQLIVVDYKSTSTSEEITLDGEYKEGYKRQIEVYQWLLRHNGFDVSNTGFFVYCNGKKDREAFDGKLEFDIQLIPYTGDDSWVEPTIFNIKNCLESDNVPGSVAACEFCQYGEAIVELAEAKDATVLETTLS